MRTSQTLSVCISISLLCATASAQALTHVWKVGGGGAHFADLQSAVDAALDGDLLLVRSGTYAAFLLHDKSLSILPAQGATVNIAGETHIEDLSSGKLTLLGNMTCQSVPNAGTGALVVRNNQGAVVLRNSSFRALTYREGVRLMQSDIVVIDQCQIYGGDSPWLYSHAGQGMVARVSNLASFRSSFQGGRGWANPCDGFHWGYAGNDGGAGYECPDGFLFASGGSFRGGAGGESGEEHWDPFTGAYTPPGVGGTGGAGIFLGSSPASMATPRVDGLAYSASAGAGGPGNCGDPGSAGQSILINNGSAGTLAGTPREFSLQSLAYESSQVAFSATGAPGETVYLMISQQPAFLFDASLFGCQLLRQPLLSTSRPIGVIQASGLLQVQVRMRALRPSDEAGTFMVQAVFVAPGGSAKLSNATAIALVDPSVSLN